MESCLHGVGAEGGDKGRRLPADRKVAIFGQDKYGFFFQVSIKISSEGSQPLPHPTLWKEVPYAYAPQQGSIETPCH